MSQPASTKVSDGQVAPGHLDTLPATRKSKRLQQNSSTGQPPAKRFLESIPAIFRAQNDEAKQPPFLTSDGNPFSSQALLDHLSTATAIRHIRVSRETDLDSLYLVLAEVATEESSFTPKGLKQALKCPEADDWKAAYDREINSLIKKQTFSEFLHKLPLGTTAIRTNLVFKKKIGLFFFCDLQNIKYVAPRSW